MMRGPILIIANDRTCPECGATPEPRTCGECGVTAQITDCGHMAQPRPIAAGRADGSAQHRVFCELCA